MDIFYRGPNHKQVSFITKNVIVNITFDYSRSTSPVNHEHVIYMEARMNCFDYNELGYYPVPEDCFYFRFSKPTFSCYMLLLSNHCVPDITKRIIITIIRVSIHTYKQDDFVLSKELSISQRLHYYLRLGLIPREKIFESLLPNFSS